MEQLITVATFNQRAKAEPLKERLKASGLWADIFDESSVQKTWFGTSQPKAHIRLRVKKEDLEQAQVRIQEWDAADGMMGSAVRCPECGSSRIEYPQFSRRTGSSLFLALFASMGLIERQYFCQSCHFTWPDKVAVEPELDVLNWPKGK